jgi:hypothetical protein
MVVSTKTSGESERGTVSTAAKGRRDRDTHTQRTSTDAGKKKGCHKKRETKSQKEREKLERVERDKSKRMRCVCQ